MARRIAEAGGGNRAILALELDKLALYLDAAPERPQAARPRGARRARRGQRGGRSQPPGRRVADGDPALLQAELLRLAGEGVEGIPLIRAVLRRMMLLARLRAEVERGNSLDAVMASQGKSLFWKEKDSIGRQLARWRSDALAKASAGCSRRSGR